MRNIIKDIETNCPECNCSVEKTVEYLVNHGDIGYTSEHYREIWYFYKGLLETLKNKRQARETTLELMKIKHDKFKYIQKWAKKMNI